MALAVAAGAHVILDDSEQVRCHAHDARDGTVVQGMIPAAEDKTVDIEVVCKDDTLTVAEGTFTIANMTLNIGLLSIPFVFAQSGFLAAFFVLLATMVCVYTGSLLGHVLAALRRQGVARPTYGDAAEAIGGPCFSGFVTVVSNIEVLMYFVSNMVTASGMLLDMLPGCTQEAIILMYASIGLCLSILSDKTYSKLALLSSACVVLAMVLCVCAGLELPDWAPTLHANGPLSAVPSTFSVIIFGAATHPTLTSAFHTMRSRTDFEKACCFAWMFYAIVAAGFGTAMYFMFGDALRANVLDNVGKDIHLRPLAGWDMFVAVSGLLLVFKTQVSLVPVSRPLVETIAAALGFELPRGNGGFRCFLLSVPVFTGGAAAAIVLMNNLVQLESVSGGYLMTFNAFIFPGFAYLRICQTSFVGRCGGIAAVIFGLGLAMLLSVSMAD